MKVPLTDNTESKGKKISHLVPYKVYLWLTGRTFPTETFLHLFGVNDKKKPIVYLSHPVIFPVHNLRWNCWIAEKTDWMLTRKRFVRRWDSCSEEPYGSSVCLEDHRLETCQPKCSKNKSTDSPVSTSFSQFLQGLLCIIPCSGTYLNVRVTWPVALFLYAPSLQNCYKHIQTELSKTL